MYYLYYEDFVLCAAELSFKSKYYIVIFIVTVFRKIQIKKNYLHNVFCFIYSKHWYSLFKKITYFNFNNTLIKAMPAFDTLLGSGVV